MSVGCGGSGLGSGARSACDDLIYVIYLLIVASILSLSYLSPIVRLPYPPQRPPSASGLFSIECVVTVRIRQDRDGQSVSQSEVMPHYVKSYLTVCVPSGISFPRHSCIHALLPPTSWRGITFGRVFVQMFESSTDKFLSVLIRCR